MSKLTFTGHEAFHCRPLWLKKGYDFVKENKSFNEPSAVVDLGVGKNMVNAINYWIHSFGLSDKDYKLDKLAEYLFDEEGKDPFLEDTASLWLLHYYLIKTNKASIYNLFFNEFRKERYEFNKPALKKFLIRKCEENSIQWNENSIERDIGVFIKNYERPKRVNTKNLEDELFRLFPNLELISEIEKAGDNNLWYQIKTAERKEIPIEIILFIILDQYEDCKSVNFFNLMYYDNSIGSCLVITENGLYEKLQDLDENYGGITFTDDAGIKELQIRDELDKWEILNNYYEK